METNVSQDIQAYWNEVKIYGEEPLQRDFEDESLSRTPEEGEDEAEWLQEAGLSELTQPFRENREVGEKDLEKILLNYSQSQSEAIKKRVKSLNNTVKKRKNKAKHRKADVRDVFKDVENHSTGSRSATPDSLDSIEIRLEEVEDQPQQWPKASPPQLVPVFPHGLSKKPLSRAPSAPSYYLKQNSGFKSFPFSGAELFRNYVPDVAGSESLPLVSYQYVGTLPRYRSGSDPLSLDLASEDDLLQPPQHPNRRLSRSHGNLLDPSEYRTNDDHRDRTWIDSLGLSDVEKIKQLVLIEVTYLMEICGKTFKQTKSAKVRKYDGNVYGQPLHVLLERDEMFPNVEHVPHVPLIFQKLVNHIEANCLHEEGIFRIPGLKIRTDTLCKEIENNFYSNNTNRLDELLLQVSPHDVCAALKKLLRELPQPLLSRELIRMFYLTHEIKEHTTRIKILNYLTLLLPQENSATFRYLLHFFNKISQYSEFNSMSTHSVATIMAPSLFPQGFIKPLPDMQSVIKFAEESIILTECFLLNCDSLWIVPRHLISQLRGSNQSKFKKENTKTKLFRRAVKQKEHTDRLPRYETSYVNVEAPQFGLALCRIDISLRTTCEDVILSIVNQASKRADTSVSGSRHRSRPFSELVKLGINVSCILLANEPEDALSTHALYEIGGNLDQREIEHTALISHVLKENPEAVFKLHCKHKRNSKC